MRHGCFDWFRRALCAAPLLAHGCTDGEVPLVRGDAAREVGVDAAVRPSDARESDVRPADAADDATPAAAYYSLVYDPVGTPRFMVRDDVGQRVARLSPAGLAVLAATTWELATTNGGAKLVLRGNAMQAVGGITLSVADCRRMADDVARCAGDLGCWNTMASLPAGAPALTCRVLSDPAVCDDLAPPPGLALSLVRPGVAVYEMGAETVVVRRSATGVALVARSGASSRTIDLTLDGMLTEGAGTIDWRAALGRVRASVAMVTGWNYTRAMCPGWSRPIVEASCTAASDVVAACAAAYLDATGSATECDNALGAFLGPIVGPLELRSYCAAR